GHHWAAGAWPHRKALEESNSGRARGREFVVVSLPLCKPAAPAVSGKHQQRTGNQTEDYRAHGKEVFVDPVMQQKAENGGRNEGNEQIQREAAPSRISPDQTAAHGCYL